MVTHSRLSSGFQFILPRGERPLWLKIRRHLPQFQFTLPRGGDLLPSPVSNHDGGFNSRSREGSDDTSQDDKEHIVVVSIHAPARGATSHTLYSLEINRFQFTLPRGERLLSREACPHFEQRFNSRSREGSDGDTHTTGEYTTTFQFTLPRGERLGLRRQLTGRCLFQFTLPRGERRSIRPPVMACVG